MKECEQLQSLLKEVLRKQDEKASAFLELLEKSELRIDRTNEMVNKLTDTVKGITETYERHVNQLANNRDVLAKENTTLIEMLKTQQTECSKERQRYEELIRTFLSIKGGQNININ